jgi:hypothetical protein
MAHFLWENNRKVVEMLLPVAFLQYYSSLRNLRVKAQAAEKPKVAGRLV